MSEAELIEMLRDRQESGLQEVVARYGPLLRYVIAPILSNPQDQEECFYEVTRKIWEKADSFDPQRGSWKAWLTAIARNAAVSIARENKRRVETQQLTPELRSEDGTPEEQILQEERRMALREALGKLSTPERTLFYRKYYYMQSTAQIAAELGMSERSVEGKLYRLKQKLRKRLGGGDNA